MVNLRTRALVTTWCRPREGVFKINTDASVVKRGGSNVGVVVRTHSGEAIKVLSQKYQQEFAIEIMEAIACREGLILAKELQLQHIEVETDCQQVVQAFHRKDLNLSYLGRVVDDIRTLCSSFLSCNLRYITRSANSMAHFAARFAFSKKDGKKSLKKISPKMEELQRGFPLLLQQYKALILKNLLLSWRNKRSTFLQLFSSLFFLLLIFLIQQATVSRYGSSSYFKTVTDPKPLVAPPIPACEEKHYTRLPCFDFVWSGNDSARIREIVRRIRENNPGRPIPLEKVKAFSTRNETDDWLASNPMYCPGALHFIDRNATVISYGLQTNSTPLAKRGNFEDPTFKFQIPLQLAAEREIARSLIGDASFSWVVTLKEFAHPALEIFSAMQDSGPTFFLAIAMFSFVFQISALVTEKELKLRQLVTTSGFPYGPGFSNTYRIVWSLFPPNLLAAGLKLLFDASATPQDPGISWNGRMRCPPTDTECVVTMGSMCSCLSSVPPSEDIVPDDEDVQEEESIVKQQAAEGNVNSSIAVQIRGLVKTYAGVTKIGCCKCKRTSPYHALKFDILWDALSGEEHLSLFASIKGLAPASVKLVAQKLLAEVKLTDDAKVRSCSYSGGMKRRLSVAIALIGEPKLLILDEPTTGMDPINRRHVWDVIESAKKGRAIILTTHSMEEADILSDRIGIMAKGRLRCIGTSIRLKSRFGTGFITNIRFSGDVYGAHDQGDTFSTAQHIAVKEFFKSHLDVLPKEESKSFLTFVIPQEKEKLLKNFFAELQDREKEFGIADIQLGLTTLEEVFLNIAKKAELESAAAEGTFATLALNSGVSVQVPIGARFVSIPGTESKANPRGVMVEVYWQQDDSGALCISGHSEEIDPSQIADSDLR
ncbi:hypothetical protein DH2020_048286 [Rehmannia glutinosa]|uniref:ABC transporter domain-containing protein n=1 Tax=Rehmannia glutinosa TaxID=99300 RepID=A0ABR0U706_REHGL